ncbi:MAG TPA: hypothetical protein VHL34_16170 [Rhizomicrobium sp.]|nr:hypothetical protein [Rhizomicrobium sp.]
MKTTFLTATLVCGLLGFSTTAGADGAAGTTTTTTTTPVATPSDSAVVTAAPTPPAAPTVDVAATPAAPDPKDQIICKEEPPPTGRRIGGRKICGTKREWDLVATSAQDTTRRIQMSNAGNHPPPGNGP